MYSEVVKVKEKEIQLEEINTLSRVNICITTSSYY